MSECVYQSEWTIVCVFSSHVRYVLCFLLLLLLLLLQACSTLECLVSCCLTSDYCDTNAGYLLKGVLIHMDDTNPAVQEAACRVVERLAKAKPQVVRSGLHEVRDQHRSTTWIDRVLQSM